MRRLRTLIVAEQYRLLLIFTFSLLLRGAVLFTWSDQLVDDPDGYRLLAENLMKFGVFGFAPLHNPSADSAQIMPTAYRPPLYPLALWLVGHKGQVNWMSIGLLHVVLGVATVMFVYAVARQLKLGSAAILAALLVAADPILLGQSVRVMTETLAALLVVLCLAALIALDRVYRPQRAILAGVLLGSASLCRASLLAWSLLVLLVVLARRDQLQRRIAVAAAMLFGLAIVIGPWTARNTRQFGRPIVTTTHGGVTLLWGNNPQYYRHLRQAPWGAVWDVRELDLPVASSAVPAGNDFSRQGIDELVEDRMAYRKALEAIAQEPGMFAYACVVRLGHLLRPWPLKTDQRETWQHRWLRYSAAVWNVTVLVMACVGAWRLGRKLLRSPWLWGTLLCLSVSLVHTIYWTDMRMRAVMIPVICLLAAACFLPSPEDEEATTSFDIST